MAKAPGKVLVAGGYGVLEEENVGLSLAVDKYFFAVSERTEGEGEDIVVKVDSPQVGQTWEYRYNPTHKTIQERQNQSNVFLENAIRFSLIYACSHSKPKGHSLTITILQDRGFLSQPHSPSASRFISYGKEATKTGLGSSAGVMVVTVSSILRQELGEVALGRVNTVSQVANLAAQKKIGSNFDISTAVFGSHLYTNLLPRAAFEASVDLAFQKVEGIDPRVGGLAIRSERLKSSYCCMLDLKKGSNTRKMVSGFITALNLQPAEVVGEFYTGSKGFVQSVYEVIAGEEDFAVIKARLGEINKAYRVFLQKYSTLTGIPVEPAEFRPFLDQICSIGAVLYAICPGSGGYDAIFVLSAAQNQQEIDGLKQQLRRVCLEHSLEADINDTKILWGAPSISEEDLTSIDFFLKQ